MNFKDKLEKFRTGGLSEEERTSVEIEIEKVRLINEYLDEIWGEELLPPDTSDENQSELKKVKTKIRKNNGLIVFMSIAIFVVIYLLSEFVIIPVAESMYWNPGENTFNCQFTDDLELAINAYSEMFSHNRYIGNVYYEKTGFAKYEIAIQHGNASTGDIETFYTSSDKGKLDLKYEFWGYAPANAFENACWPVYTMSEKNKQMYYDSLCKFPDYITVTASVSFSEDMDMDEIISLQNEISRKDGHITWIGIRNCDPSEQRYPIFGIAPYIGGYIRGEVNEIYPYFDVKRVKDEDMTADILKTHANSILSLCIDLHKNGLPDAFVNAHTPEKSYLEEIREYLTENGLYSYGCYITAPADVFIDLLDSGIASQVWPDEAYIDF